MKKIQYIFGAFGIFCIGIFAGILMQESKFFEQKIFYVKETLPEVKVPVVSFSKIENGILYGSSDSSELRVKIGEKNEISIQKGQEFSFEVTEILPNLFVIPAPEGMQFVASKRGSKYWALDAPEAAMLSVQNRIFFPTEKDAQNAGFIRGK